MPNFAPLTIASGTAQEKLFKQHRMVGATGQYIHQLPDSEHYIQLSMSSPGFNNRGEVTQKVKVIFPITQLVDGKSVLIDRIVGTLDFTYSRRSPIAQRQEALDVLTASVATAVAQAVLVDNENLW